MRHTVPTPSAFAPRRLIVLALLIGSAACEVPNFEGEMEESEEAAN